MSTNYMPSPYAPKAARQVDAVGDFTFIIGPETGTARALRMRQWFAEERKDGRSLHRRRFPSEEAALNQATMWATFRRCQVESPL